MTYEYINPFLEKNQPYIKCNKYKIEITITLSFKIYESLIHLNDIQDNNIYLLKEINNCCKNLKLNKGDIIEVDKINNITTSKYRNDFLYIYDGENIIELDTEFDEYGYIPSIFLTFTDFPPGYWVNCISHNWIHHIKLYNLDYKETYDNSMYCYSFNYRNNEWKIGSNNKLIIDENTIISCNWDEDYDKIYDLVVIEN